MGEATVPPKFVVAPVELVYGDMPRPVAMTGLRIWGLGWKHQYKRTDPIREEFLLEICGVRRSQLYEHLRRLMANRVLRYTTKDGRYLFWFDDLTQPQRIRAGPSPEIRTHDTLSVVVDSSLSDSESDSLILQEKEQQQVVSESWGECEGGNGESGKPDWSPENRIEVEEWEVRLDVLAGMGVLEPTRSRLAEQEYATVEYLEGWEDWFLTQDAVGSGFVVCRMRDGDEAPGLSRERKAQRDRQLRAAVLVVE